MSYSSIVKNERYLLEINPLNGIKEMRLLPMSARCGGRGLAELIRERVVPAWRRFQAATTVST